MWGKLYQEILVIASVPAINGCAVSESSVKTAVGMKTLLAAEHYKLIDSDIHAMRSQACVDAQKASLRNACILSCGL